MKKKRYLNFFIITGFLERLRDGDDILIAEGYMWEFERRGYLKAGGNVPEVVLDNPDLVRIMHREFVHAGSDVVEAFTVCMSDLVKLFSKRKTKPLQRVPFLVVQ